MSWSVSKTSSDKAELQETVDNEQNCPQEVRDAVKSILSAVPEGKSTTVSSYGHHNNGEIVNVGITVQVN